MQRMGSVVEVKPEAAEEYVRLHAEVWPGVLAALTAKISAVTPDPTEASLAARAAFARVVGREALTLAFDDVFRVLAWIFFAALILVPFCRMPARTGAPPEAAVH